MCNQISKAERFFPVLGISPGKDQQQSKDAGEGIDFVLTPKPTSRVCICMFVRHSFYRCFKALLCRAAECVQLLTGSSCAGAIGARQLEVSLKAVGQATSELQELWVDLAPHSHW